MTPEEVIQHFKPYFEKERLLEEILFDIGNRFKIYGISSKTIYSCDK